MSLAVYEAYTPEKARANMEQFLTTYRENTTRANSNVKADPLANSLVVSLRELSRTDGKSRKPRKPKKRKGWLEVEAVEGGRNTAKQKKTWQKP